MLLIGLIGSLSSDPPWQEIAHKIWAERSESVNGGREAANEWPEPNGRTVTHFVPQEQMTRTALFDSHAFWSYGQCAELAPGSYNKH